MTRIAHLTDLHFGMERAELVDPLTMALRAAAPDMVVVSGDLSHRARRAQFRAGMAFLRGLGLPFIVLPGNHDVPLFNLAARFLWPFGGWRWQVGHDLAPQAQVGPCRIVSANTADPFSWRRGVLRRGDLRRVAAGLEVGGDAVNILACHHPLVEPPGFQRGETRGAAAALPDLVRRGVHVVLSGHLHHWDIGLGITPDQPQPLLFIQTGTALCGRHGEGDHGFSLLDIDGRDIGVTPWIVDENTLTYQPRAPLRFHRSTDGWRRV